MPRGGFLCEIYEQSGYRRIVWYKVAVVTSEAQESLYVGRCFWHGPIRYALEFLWAHLEVVLPYNYPKVFDFFFLEFAFFRFEVKVILFELC